MSAARRAMSDEQGSAETILREAHLATYRPLVMLCLGSQETRSPQVEAVQTGNLRIWRASSRRRRLVSLSRWARWVQL